MDHVTPDYILGQKRRLQAERRYSPGLLLTVIRSNDYLEEKYLKEEKPEEQFFEPEEVVEEEPELITEYKSDPSIHKPLTENGLTPGRECGIAFEQLKMDIPKAVFENWVKDAISLLNF